MQNILRWWKMQIWVLSTMGSLWHFFVLGKRVDVFQLPKEKLDIPSLKWIIILICTIVLCLVNVVFVTRRLSMASEPTHWHRSHQRPLLPVSNILSPLSASGSNVRLFTPWSGMSTSRMSHQSKTVVPLFLQILNIWREFRLHFSSYNFVAQFGFRYACNI